MRSVKVILVGVALVIGVIVVSTGVLMGPTLYRAMVGLKRYETIPPTLPVNLGDPAILIFSKTNGYRDEAQIEAANASLSAIASRHGWSSYVTENAAVFNPPQLQRFEAVVWNSVSGDVLTLEQRRAFRDWLEAGGGFVGLHGAGGDPQYAWKWYVDELIGAQFIGHTLNPHFQQATIIVDDQNHPATRDLGPSWQWIDEWYSFASSPRAKGYHILARVDESTYSPIMRLLPFLKGKDIRMGADHPVVWTHCVGNGRALYSALGHQASSYAEPKHQQLIAGAISWAAGLEGPRCVGGREVLDSTTDQHGHDPR